MNAPANDPKPALARWLVEALGAHSAQVTEFRRLGGGAIQENWALDAVIAGGRHPGRLDLVLRTDAPSGLAVSTRGCGSSRCSRPPTAPA